MRRRILGPYLLVLVVGLTTCPHHSMTQESVSGSYEIRVCSGPCGFDDETNVLVKGFLVLREDALAVDWEEIPESVRIELFMSASILRHEGHLNGCYSLQTVKNAHSFAGISSAGFTHWREFAESDSISFSLYRSADGGYHVRGRFEGDTFRGVGTSWHVPSLHDTPQDTVVARRIGEPAFSLCVGPKTKG